MSARNLRGNALTMVLMLIGVIFVIVFAGTSLQPIELRAIDEHYEYQHAQALLDAALEESVARMNSGGSPAFTSEVRDQGVTARRQVQQLGTPATAGDDVTLLITTRMPADRASRSDSVPREWKMTANATLHKTASGWRVASFAQVSAGVAALTSSP